MALRHAEAQPVTEIATPEHIYYGSEEVIQHIFLREKLLKEGNIEEANKIRPLVYFVGGGHKVAWEVSAIRWMHEKGWFAKRKIPKTTEEGEEQEAPPIIPLVFGASGGAIVVGHGVLGNRHSAKIFQKNVDNRFADIRNVTKPGEKGERGFVDFVTFHDETLGREFAIQTEDFSDVGSEVYAVLINAATGLSELIRLNDHPQPNKVLAGSSNIPYIGNVACVEINGQTYIDGDLGGLPVDLLMQFDPTDILIVLCDTFESIMKKKKSGEMLEKLSEWVHHPVRRVLMQSPNALLHTVKRLFSMQWQKDNFHFALMGPGATELDTLTMDAKKIDTVMSKSDLGIGDFFESYNVA